MAALSIHSIFWLNANIDIWGTDYLVGVLMMVAGFIVMQRGTLYAADMSFKDVRNNMKKVLKSE